jgi:AcrR family transcriptional regulator
VPRTEQQNERMREERREQIFEAALELFADRGLAATKISDIARTAGISQGLLYHYFGAKEAVFTELIRDAFAKMNLAARGLDKARLPAKQKIETAIAELIGSLEQSDRFARTILLIAQATASQATPAEARAVIEEHADVPYRVMARIMRKGQAEGTVVAGDPRQLAVVFWAQIKGLALHRASHPKDFRAPAVELLHRTFLCEQRR